MVKDQFGMVGLLTFIRAAETDPNLVSLALGQDLTALGLNLNSQDNLYPTFGGPWAETPCRAQDIDYHVPPEYIINHSIRFVMTMLLIMSVAFANSLPCELRLNLFFKYSCCFSNRAYFFPTMCDSRKK